MPLAKFRGWRPLEQGLARQSDANATTFGVISTVSEALSTRLVDQRMRNRIIDAMSWLAEGAAAVQRMSAQEYFEMFYDWVDHDNPV